MGVRKSVLYFLNPRYWTGNEGQKVKGDEYFLSCVCYYFFHALYGLILLTRFFHLPFIEGGVCSCIFSTRHEENSMPDDEDVLEEENVVKQRLTQGVVDANVAVQLHGIVKTYPGTYITLVSAVNVKEVLLTMLLR